MSTEPKQTNHQTKTNKDPTEALNAGIVDLMQCGKSACGYVLSEEEQVWVPHPDRDHSRIGTCPKCGNNSFYHLNALGQKRKHSEPRPWGVKIQDIKPSPRMGLKMKRRILAAKRRAISANSQK